LPVTQAFSNKVQVPPFLRERHNAALGLLCHSSLVPRGNLSLRPLNYIKTSGATKPYGNEQSSGRESFFSSDALTFLSDQV